MGKFRQQNKTVSHSWGVLSSFLQNGYGVYISLSLFQLLQISSMRTYTENLALVINIRTKMLTFSNADTLLLQGIFPTDKCNHHIVINYITRVRFSTNHVLCQRGKKGARKKRCKSRVSYKHLLSSWTPNYAILKMIKVSRSLTKIKSLRFSYKMIHVYHWACNWHKKSEQVPPFSTQKYLKETQFL